MKTFFSILFILVSTVFFAQQKHTVQTKETLYGISKQYNVSTEQIEELNPFLKERGLQIGDELLISKSTITTKPIDAVVTENAEFRFIEIPPKETLYNLTKTYGISEEALLSLNPSLTAGLKVGDVIRIPKKEVQNPEGFHKIQAGETLYTLAQKYNTTVEDFYLANRDLQTDNIQVGSFVKIPTESTSVKTTEVAQVTNGMYQHTVSEKETVFSVLSKYDISLEELLEVNPTLTSGLKVGEKINIPLKSDRKFATENTQTGKDDTIRVSMFLPFFLHDDSKKAQKEVATFFLTGAKLALDSLAQKGKKIQINVYDSGNDSEFNQTVTETDFSKIDLIVGPFYASNIIDLSNKLQNRVPIVSPIVANSKLLEYPNVIVAEVEDEVFCDEIINEINSNYNQELIYLFTTTKEESVAKYMQSKLEAEGKTVKIVYTAEEMIPEQNLITEEFQSIIPVLVSDKGSSANAFITQIEALDNTTTKPYSVYYLNAFDKSSNKEILSQKGFAYVTSRKVDTNGWKEKSTLGKYKKDYCQNPPKYAVLGFDIVYDLVNRIDSDKNLTNHLNEESKRLASKFKYKKTANNSFQNIGVMLIKYPKL